MCHREHVGMLGRHTARTDNFVERVEKKSIYKTLAACSLSLSKDLFVLLQFVHLNLFIYLFIYLQITDKIVCMPI